METLQNLAWGAFLATVVVICATTVVLVVFAAAKVMKDQWDK